MPSKEGIDLAGELLNSIKKLGPDDVDFVLTVLEASFPKVKSKPTSGNKTGGGPSKKDPKPSKTGSKAQEHGEQGGGGKGNSTERGGGGYGKAVTPPASEVEDLLPGVIQRLVPLTQAMPVVQRDPSADSPKSDRKSVQKRLNSKRAELQKTLEAFSGADNSYYGFESLNKVQAFLLAAFDASNTDGVRLRTDPLPEDFPTMIEGLKIIIKERKESNQVTDYGFFSNTDHQYRPPSGGETDDAD